LQCNHCIQASAWRDHGYPGSAGEKTKLTLHSFAKGFVPFAPAMLNGMEAGWSQSLAKMTQLVAP